MFQGKRACRMDACSWNLGLNAPIMGHLAKHYGILKCTVTVESHLLGMRSVLNCISMKAVRNTDLGEEGLREIRSPHFFASAGYETRCSCVREGVEPHAGELRTITRDPRSYS